MHNRNLKIWLPMALSVALTTAPLPILAQDVPSSSGSGETTFVPPSSVNVDQGTHIFDASTLGRLSSLSVAPGATAVIDFGSNPQLGFTGDVQNQGSIYAISTNPAVTTASISALNIFNGQGGLISSIVPAGFAGAVSQLNLSLTALHEIVNAGTIASSASLSMTAGSIVNQGTMTAAQNIDLSSTLASITNSGTISAMAGNINLSNLATANLLVNGAGGRMEALLGNISVMNAALNNDKLGIDLLGGDFISKELNLTNPQGVVEVNIGEITGTLNIEACAAHVLANTASLSMGRFEITGDPTIYNSGGDVVISQNIDLRPQNFTPPGPVSLAIVAQGNVTAQAGVTKIDVSVEPNQLTSPWPGAGDGTSIMIVAGVDFTVTPTNSSPPQVNDDTTNTIQITGASATGGNINLANVNISANAGFGPTQPAGSPHGGNITLAAFNGTNSGSGTGNVAVGNVSANVSYPASTTPSVTPTPSGTNDLFGKNGTVSILGEGNIQVGTVSTTGNIVNSDPYNGNVMIASADIKMMQSTQAQTGFFPNYSLLQEPTLFGGKTNTAASPGMTNILVTDTTNIGTNQNLYLDPLGPNAEKIVVSIIPNTTSGVIIPQTAITKYHDINEHVLTDASSITINPGAGYYPGGANPASNITANGGIFAPDMSNLSTGNITIGGIQSGAAATVATAGTVTINGNIGLSQNTTAYDGTGSETSPVRLPTINITGINGVTISTGATVDASIANCQYCANTSNIVTTNLVNNGTLSAGTASSTSSNAFINVSSPGHLTVSGSGSVTVPHYSVIEFAAADNHTLTINAPAQTITTDTGSIVILNAQGSAGTVEIANSLNIQGAPIISINTPNLNLNQIGQVFGPSPISIGGAGATFLIGSGYTTSPLAIQVSNVVILSGNSMSIRAADTQNLTITGIIVSPYSVPTLAFNGPALLATSGGGTSINAGLNLVGSIYTSNNPSGLIKGYAFQPSVGGRLVAGNNTFASSAGYPYHAVINLLGNLMATKDPSTGVTSQQFQTVATYTQYYSMGYVTQAAKQLGLSVSAGAWAEIQPDSAGSMQLIDYERYIFDTSTALWAAQTYGNVVDLVIGNENIKTYTGGTTPTAVPSITTLTSLISGGTVPVIGLGNATQPGAQFLRNTFTNPLTGTNFTSATLPVTTRQEAGVLNRVTDATDGTAMTQLVNNCEDHIYGNYYPFFNEPTLVPAILANPNISKSAFTTLVTGLISSQFTGNVSSFSTAHVTTKIRVGETGWATPLVPLTGTGSSTAYGYNGNGLPQQNALFATWYYEAMQNWSSSQTNGQTGGNGVIISGYFESYNEPSKGINGANPNSIAVTLAADAAAQATSITASQGSAFTGLTPESVLLNPNSSTEEVQNVFLPVSGNTITITNTNFPGSLVFAHSTGESLNAGTPEEPFFGVFEADGSSLALGLDGYTFTLSRITQKYPIKALSIQLLQLSAPAPSSAGIAATSQPSGLSLSSFLGGLQSTVLGSINNSTRLDSGTIAPTDINPERLPGDGSQLPVQSFQQFAVNQTLPLINPQQDQSNLSLANGNALFVPDHDIAVTTPLAKISIKSGAAALVLHSDDGLTVYNLYDNKTGSIAVTIGDESYEVPLGRHLSLSDKQDQKFEDLNKGGLGHRNVTAGKIGTLKTFTSEFSLFSAFVNSRGLRNMLTSADRQTAAKAHKIMKTAAALYVMNKNRESFKASN